ncbi:MAG: Fe-S cluster assembly protein SufD [Planctomycetes bacterium]|nr:Fe-S cluster assembly protein SufD [Planctomycetota bacterium]
MSRETFIADFERLGRDGAFAELRRRAIDRFAALGFPTGREEEWRFTDVTPVAETAFKLAAGASLAGPLAETARGPLKACQLTFVNGRYAPQFSNHDAAAESLGALLKKGAAPLEAHLGQQASGDKNPFAALNTAFFRDGAVLRIPKGAVLEQPLHLLFISVPTGEPFVTHPRILIVVEEGAQATIVESYIGPAGGVYLTNAVTEIFAGPESLIDHYKVQRESAQAFHFATLQARQDRASVFASHSISLGAAIARNDIGTALDGEGAECTLNGLYEAGGRQLVDHHTMIDHAKPHGTSRELYKGILNGQARGVFDGRIIVRPNAQKTNAMQTNRNLLLSDKALVNTKPQLEILANDVKCKHGATIGHLDRDMMFYLRSRGIGFEEARRLLIHAFASEIVDEVKVDAVRAQLGGCLHILAEAHP